MMVLSRPQTLRRRQEVPPEVQARRELQSATLSTPLGGLLLYDGDLGSRLANVQYSTRLGAGFDRFSATLLSRDGGPLVPYAEALYYWRTWDFGLLRYSLAGESAWVGELWQPELGDPVLDDELGPACTVTLNGSGLYECLTNLIARPDASYADSDATASASELARMFIKSDDQLPFGRPIGGHRFLAETGIGVADQGLSVGYQDYPLDLILAALRAGSATGLEYWPAVFEPETGFWIQPYGQGPTRWHLPYWGSGIRLVKNLRELATDVIALVTDGENNNQATDWYRDPDAPALHNGIRRERAISQDRVGLEGGLAGRDTYALNHRNPFGFVGSWHFDARDQGRDLPHVKNAEGVWEPCQRVRCGQQVRIPDLQPFDPTGLDVGRAWDIESTTTNVDAGTFELTLDQRPIKSRPAERPAEIAARLRASDPAATGKQKIIRSNTSGLAVPGGNAIELSDDNHDPSLLIEIDPVRRTHYSVDIRIQLTSASPGDDEVFWGWTLDDEDFSETDESRAGRDFFLTAWAGLSKVYSEHWEFDAPAGNHTIHTWVLVAGGSNYTAGATTIKVEGS